jgi:hypothetical protein
MIRKHLLYSVSAAVAVLAAAPLAAQDSKKPERAPAAAKADEKSPAQVKAEKLIIQQLSFAEADFSDCMEQLFKKIQEADPEKDPKRKGMGIFNRVNGETKPVTLELTKVSAWDAAQMMAAAAGVKVTPREKGLMFYSPDYTPVPLQALTGWRKSKEWQSANKVQLASMGFAEASMEEACKALTERAAAGAKGTENLTISAEGVEGPVTMLVRDTTLAVTIEIIAETVRAEIVAEKGKIIFRPLKAAKE